MNFLTQKRRYGFTFVELLIGASISLVIIGGAMGVFMYGMRTWQAESIVSELHQNLESAMEHIRHDLRLSSVGVGLMSFYPTNAVEYTAISLPQAVPGPDGLLVRDLDPASPNHGRMIWGRTVVYHVRPGAPDELRRTVFSPRNTNATPAQLYAQLVQVVASTDDTSLQAAAMVGESMESQVVFRNLVRLRIRPPEILFDGYAPTYERARDLNWGSVVLGAGLHDLTFTVVGKNESSTGYKVGVDYFTLSASASRREGEMFLPMHSRPADPFYQATASGGTLAAEDMSAHGSGWSGNAQLTFTPQNVNDEVTFKVFNDLWCDTQFDLPPGAVISNVSQKIDTSFVAEDPYIADFVISMDKGVTWTADSLAAGPVGEMIITNTVPVFNVIYGDGSQPSVMRYNGARVRLCFQSSPNEHFFVHNVAIMRQSSGTNAVAGTVTSVPFPGGAANKLVQKGTTEWTDWVNFTVDRQVNYLVRFERKVDASYMLGGAATWTYGSATPPMSYINGSPDSRLVLLKELEVAYPARGLYRSGVFDTRLANPTYRQINWSQKENFPDGDIDIRVRTGSLSDMSDAVAWLPLSYFQSNIGNNIAALSGGRYVQYEVLFAAASPFGTTAILRDVTIDWEATPGLVDLVSGFARGPDYGIIQAEVNGQLFTKGVEVEMEIFKDGPFGTNQVAGVMEVRPLNTGR